MDDLTSLQAARFPSILFRVPSTLVLPRFTNATDVAANVTILGASRTGLVRFDVNLQPSVFNMQPGGLLTFRNMVLLNMVPRTGYDPLGLLSCLLWFVNRSPSTVQLSVIDSMLLLPPSELDYLQLTINPSSGVAPWTLGPSGLFVSPPVGTATANSLVFSSADERQQTWTNVSLMVLDASNDPQAKLVWTGLDALLLPGEPQSNLVLPLVQSLGPVFSLSVLGAQPTDQDTWGSSPGPVRMIMSQSTVVDNITVAGMEDPVTVLSDTIIVGNTLSPNGAIFDLAGLSSMPGKGPTGYVTIGNKSPDTSATLYLRDMVLVNLQPAACVVDPLQDPTGVLASMGNYTSLLWLFNVANRDTSAGDIPGQLVLQNVTLVMPVTEFKVLLQILIGTLKYNIDPLAYQLLRQELGNMEIAAERVGANIKYERNVGSILVGTSPPSPDALGTITFPVFNWFGISGKQVSFTSKKPDAMIGVMLPVDADLWPPLGAPPPPVSPPPPDQPQSPLSGDTSSQQASSLAHSSWQLGLLVGLVVMVAIGLGVGGWYVLRRTRGKKAALCMESSSTDSSAPDKDKAGADMEAGSGAAAGAAAMTMPTCEDPNSDAGKQYNATLLQGSRQQQTSSSLGSQRGSPTAPVLLHGGVAPSPFEAVALGLVSMVASGPEAAQSNGHGFASVAGTATGGSGGEVRMDTQALLERIFCSVGADAWRVGHLGAINVLPPLGQSSSGSEGSAINGMWPPPRPATLQLSTPTGSMRHEIQRQMEVLRQELGTGQDEAPQWDVQFQLGKGAHGVVYKGSWRGLDVAIKRVIFQVLGDPLADSRRKTALREAAINGTLHHPNIVTTYSHDMQPLTQAPLGGASVCMQQFADWQLFIIQEYCDGGSLYTAIQEQRYWDDVTKQPLLPEILALATDIACGCAYIHAKQIIHGDLKPDNVLLKHKTAPTAQGAAGGGTTAASEDGSCTPLPPPACTAKVADFGMSIRISGNNTHVSGVHHGTPLYVSPEILQDGRASKAADVYSFGVILWELYHGISAWNHLVRMVGMPTRKSFPAFHPGMFNFDSCPLSAYAQLGQACLSMNPADRPSFAQILEALQAMTADAAPQAAQRNSPATADPESLVPGNQLAAHWHQADRCLAGSASGVSSVEGRSAAGESHSSRACTTSPHAQVAVQMTACQAPLAASLEITTPSWSGQGQAT